MPERWLKWARRRPTLAASMGLLVAGSAAGIAGTVFFVASIRAEQVRTKEEQVKTNQALALATSARDRNRTALGSLTDDVVQRMVQRGKALDAADLAFLRKVRGYYEEWPLEPEPLAALKFRAAGLGRIGGIFFAIDQNDEAKSCLEAAIRTYDEALRRWSGDRVLGDERLLEMAKLYRILVLMNQPVAAEMLARKLIEALEPLASESPGHRLELPYNFIRLANCLTDQGRFDEAEVSIRTGLSGLEKLRLANPRDLPTLNRELMAYFSSALAAFNAGRKDVAEARYHKLFELAEAALASFPGEPALCRQRIQALGGIVGLIWKERPAEALEIQHRRMELARNLLGRFPENVQYQNDVLFGEARTYDLCASLNRPRRRGARPGTRHREGNSTGRGRAGGLRPSPCPGRRDQCPGRLFEATNRPRQAVEQYDRIAASFAPWTKLPGRSGEVVPVLIRANRRSAQLLSRLGDHAEAAKRLSAILDLCEPKDRPAIEQEIVRERLAVGDQAVTNSSSMENPQGSKADGSIGTDLRP